MRKSRLIALAFAALVMLVPASAQAHDAYVAGTGATGWSLNPHVDAGITDTAADGKRAYSHFYRSGDGTRYLIETRNGNGSSALSASGAFVWKLRACTNNNITPESCTAYVTW